MEQKAKKFKVVDIPLAHFTVRQNMAFMDSMAEMVRSGEWTTDDLREYLEFCGFRHDTMSRFVRGVELRLSGQTAPKQPPKPKRSEGAMSPEEAEKIEDPEGRRLVKKYLHATEAPSGEPDTAPSASADETTSKAKKAVARHDRHR